MKSHRPNSSMLPWRSIARCLMLFSLLVLLPSTSHGRVRSAASKPAASGADTPSGFLPGLISYFAGEGTNGTNYVDGSVPTQVQLSPLFTATDSHGNNYIATTGAIYLVYAGGTIPTALANVTTNANPAVTPQQGRIYQVAGLTGVACFGSAGTTNCGEGQPLDQVTFGGISGFAIDSSDNLYYSDPVDSNGDAIDVVRRIDAQTSIVTTVAGQFGIVSTPPNIGDGGPATGSNATLFNPTDLKIDSFGNLFINDFLDDVIRVVYSGTKPPALLTAEGVSPTAGYIYTVAGMAGGYCTTVGGCGDGTSATTSAILANQESIAIDASGNLYIADTFPGNSAAYVRMVYAGGTVPTLLNLALNPTGGTNVAPTNGYIYAVTGYGANPQYAACTLTPCGDGGLVADMQFGYSSSLQAATLFLTLDASGNLYVADEYDFAIRKIDTSGYASTVAGIDDPNQTPPANPPANAGGPATSTQLTGPIAISFDTQNNLYIVDTDLVWVVAPLLPQTITFSPFETATYGVNAISLTATASSGLPVSYAVGSGPGEIIGSKLVVTGAGSVVVVASQIGNSQYAAAAPISQTLTVDPALLGVAADNASREYQQPNPAFTANYTGFVNGDTFSNSVSGQPVFSTTATISSPTGSYPITISQGTLASSKYSFSLVQGATLTITGVTPQTINFPQPANLVYGQASTATLAATSSSGLPVQYLVVSGPARNVAGGSTLTITGGGTIVVTASQVGNNIYSAAAPVTRNVAVNPAPLTVTGPIVTIPYGASTDPSTFPPATITGFVGNDNASLVTGSAQYLTTAVGTPNAGTYPITVTQGTLALLPGAASSYALSIFVPGQLIVTPAPQTISLNPIPAGQIYGNSVQLTALASSGLPVTFTATGSAYFYNGTNVTNPSQQNDTVQLQLSGIGTVTVTATQAGGGNFGPAPVITQTFTVGQAPLNVQATPPQVREQGAQNPIFPYTIGQAAPGQPSTVGVFVNGDTDIPAVVAGIPALTTTATPDSPPGIYQVVPTQGTLTASNYYFVFYPGQLTITPPGNFTITASPSSLTIPSGLTGQATITITPLNVYQGTVMLSCGQVPANVSCIVSPSTYVFPGSQTVTGTENPAQGTVTVVASATTVVGALPLDSSLSRAGLFLIPGGLAGLLLAFARKRAVGRGLIFSVLSLLALGSCMLGMSSCGGGGKSIAAPTGTSTIMILGSGTSVSGDGAVTSSAPLSVTIQ